MKSVIRFLLIALTLIGDAAPTLAQEVSILADWSELGVTTNTLGKIFFTDVTAHLSPLKFYRARAFP